MSDYNYFNDRRVQAAQLADYTPTVHNEDGSETPLPVRWVVCPCCDGEGKHVNPSIDCEGLTNEDFDQDPDFRHEYMSGHYDVPCYQCRGRTTVQAVDESECDPELLEEYRQQREAEEDYQRTCAAERAMGA